MAEADQPDPVLLEFVAQAIWQTFRLSDIAPDWARDMPWSDLLTLGEGKPPDSAPVRTIALARAEARAAILIVETWQAGLASRRQREGEARGDG